MRKHRWGVLLFGLLCLQGCVGLGARTVPINFEDPFTKLGISRVEPHAEEQAGVALKFLPPPGNIRNSTEEIKIYARVQGDQGALIQLVQKSKETYKPGSQPHTYIVRSESRFQKQSGSILEELEITDRGEIVKLLEGKHDSKDGKFSIVDWTRTPVFPAGLVQVGHAWNYQESMALQLDSLLLKQKESSPYKISASSKLTGFAEVKKRRCAVIETEADQIETQRFTVLGKDLTLYIRAKIKETLYLDYKVGMVVAKIAKAQTFTNSSDGKISDESLSQSISYLS